jgi:hypothetical protein
MLTSTVKRFILPFSSERTREPFSSEVEAAAVFAFAEFERNKGGGLILKQPEENLVGLSKIGFPLWLFPKNETTVVFDGLENFSYSISYAQMPSAQGFLESLDANSTPREKYVVFLSDQGNYFQRSLGEKKINLRGLIADPEFKNELSIYRKQALEVTDQTFADLAFLPPLLEEATINSMLNELEKLQASLREDAEKLPEILRFINRTTSQYVTEINYDSEAVKEEADAKIKAQEEIVNPQIAKLNSEYKHKIKNVTENFDHELENLYKLRTKTRKLIESDEEKNKQYQREAKAQAQKNHAIYEKRWKEKSREMGKELSGLKKELKTVEKNIKVLTSQKISEVSKLNFELNAEVKLARQPLVVLAAARDAKMQIFKQEKEKLMRLEKPVVEGIYRNIQLREKIASNFEVVGFKDRQLKASALLYIPFYMVCFEAGHSRRYLILPPSTISPVDFSAKLKGAFGMSKIRNLLSPRFNAVTALISKVQVLINQNSIFEGQLGDLAEKNNFLKTKVFRDNAAKGLVYLKHEGWLSDKEQQELNKRLNAV